MEHIRGNLKKVHAENIHFFDINDYFKQKFLNKGWIFVDETVIYYEFNIQNKNYMTILKKIICPSMILFLWCIDKNDKSLLDR